MRLHASCELCKISRELFWVAVLQGIDTLIAVGFHALQNLLWWNYTLTEHTAFHHLTVL